MMNGRSTIRACVIATTIAVLTMTHSVTLGFQSRDHLTPQEQELIRDAQILDKRIDVFIKAVDRRLLVLSGKTVGEKQSKKELEAWGELPTGSPAELMGDIARIFDEAITNIDDVNSRDEKSPLIPKALRKLAEAASRTVDELRPMQSQAGSEIASSSFDRIVQHAEEIVDAASKLPAPTEKKAKDKNKTEKTKTTN